MAESIGLKGGQISVTALCTLHHSHKKRKDSLEARAVFT